MSHDRCTTMTLSDGRRLAYREHGAPHGWPLLYFHGLPGSAALALDPDAMDAAGVRLVTVERPGFGGSDPLSGRTLLDTPTDVRSLLDELGIDAIALLGASAGAPHALACASRLGPRVRAVGLVSGIGPVFDHPELDPHLPEQQQLLLPLARQDMETAAALVQEVARPLADAWAADPDDAFESWAGEWPEPDCSAILAERDLWMEILEATYGRGAATYVDEVRAAFGPWGFAVDEVTPPVHLWHGNADEMAPLAVARFVAAELPRAELTVYPGEGHVLDTSHHRDWLAVLAG